MKIPFRNILGCRAFLWSELPRRNSHEKQLALVFAFGLLSIPAMAQGVGEKTGVNAMIGASPSTADFVKMAAMSDMFEIESSKLAEQKADANSKKFAAKMIEDHSKT